MAFSVAGWGWGLATYALCHALHVGWWHWARPKRDLVWLFALFLFPVLAVLPAFGLAAAMIHFWLSAQYLAMYPAFQASSPTLHLLTFLRSKGSATEGELLSIAAGLDRSEERIDSLAAGGLVQADGKLSARGRWLAQLFLAYRSWLGLPEGRG